MYRVFRRRQCHKIKPFYENVTSFNTKNLYHSRLNSKKSFLVQRNWTEESEPSVKRERQVMYKYLVIHSRLDRDPLVVSYGRESLTFTAPSFHVTLFNVTSRLRDSLSRLSDEIFRHPFCVEVRTNVVYKVSVNQRISLKSFQTWNFPPIRVIIEKIKYKIL